jgi:hypothetical protein
LVGESATVKDSNGPWETRRKYRNLKSEKNQKASKKGKTTVIHHVVNNKSPKSLKYNPPPPKSPKSVATNPPVVATRLQIQPMNPTFYVNGGQTNTVYSFRLTADNIPHGVKFVRFEWGPGLGYTVSKSKRVRNGEASIIVQVSYNKPGAYFLSAKVYHGDTLLALTTQKIQIIGTVLSITPSTIDNAVVNIPYSFTFKAEGIPSTVKNVFFTWSFGDGSLGTGMSTYVPVVNGKAQYTATHAYTSGGSFGIVADVRDASNNIILADDYASVTVGGSIQVVYQALYNCAGWIQAQSGGQGIHVHVWDISAIPQGAVFDLKYEMYGYPDRLLLEYPVNYVALDTGWRGDSSYYGSSIYPGGIKGDGTGTELELFERGVSEYMKVTVIGPSLNTGWEYQIRCRRIV